MSHVFQTQTLLVITAETGYASIVSATDTKIKYKKPNGKTGYFPGTISGTALTYQLVDGDIDMWGLWWFQASFIVAGKLGLGEIATHYFEKPL